MTLETYLAVGELVQAAAHHHGLTGPMPFTVCTHRNEPAEADETEKKEEFFYAQHSF